MKDVNIGFSIFDLHFGMYHLCLGPFLKMTHFRYHFHFSEVSLRLNDASNSNTSIIPSTNELNLLILFLSLIELHQNLS